AGQGGGDGPLVEAHPADVRDREAEDREEGELGGEREQAGKPAVERRPPRGPAAARPGAGRGGGEAAGGGREGGLRPGAHSLRSPVFLSSASHSSHACRAARRTSCPRIEAWIAWPMIVRASLAATTSGTLSGRPVRIPNSVASVQSGCRSCFLYSGDSHDETRGEALPRRWSARSTSLLVRYWTSSQAASLRGENAEMKSPLMGSIICRVPVGPAGMRA